MLPNPRRTGTFESAKETIEKDWLTDNDLIYLESPDLRHAKAIVTDRSGWVIKVEQLRNNPPLPFHVGDELILKCRFHARCIFCTVIVHSVENGRLSMELPMVGTSYSRRAFERVPASYVGTLDGRSVQFLDISLAGACLKTNAATIFSFDQIAALSVVTFNTKVRIMGVDENSVRIQFASKSVFDRDLHFLLKRAYRASSLASNKLSEVRTKSSRIIYREGIPSFNTEG